MTAVDESPRHRGFYAEGVTWPGPLVLGRGLVIRPGAEIPEPWTSAPMVVITREILSASATTEELVDRLHGAWVERTPAVIQWAIDDDALTPPRNHRRAPMGRRRDLPVPPRTAPVPLFHQRLRRPATARRCGGGRTRPPPSAPPPADPPTCCSPTAPQPGSTAVPATPSTLSTTS